MNLTRNFSRRIPIGVALLVAISSVLLSSQVASALGTDGTADTTFNSNVNAASLGLVETTAVAVQSDGKVLVAGYETSGATSKVYRLTSNGTRDNTFTTITLGSSSSDGRPSGIVVNSDDSFFVGGYFMSVTQASTTTASPNVAKFASNGTLDTAWSTAVASATTGLPKYTTSSSNVNGMTVDSTGRVILAGMFYSKYVAPWNATAYIGVIRLHADGSVDNSFSPYATITSTASNVLVSADGAIYAAGGFGARNVVKLTSTGAVDSGFTSTISQSSYGLALQSDGKLLVGGVTDSSTGFITRLTTSGAADVTFTAPTISGGFYPSVNWIAVAPDGHIFLGGTMPSQVMKLTAAGAVDSSFATNFAASGFTGYADMVALQASGSLLVAGNISAPSTGLVRYINSQSTVTFNANGGTGASYTQSASTATNLSANTFTRTGYVFEGWNTAADGTGTPYAAGASFPFTADTTLYAQWATDGSGGGGSLPNTGQNLNAPIGIAIALLLGGAALFVIRRRRNS